MSLIKNTEIKPTVNYQVQRLYGLNAGRRIGVSIVNDGKTGDLIMKMANLLPVVVKC